MKDPCYIPAMLIARTLPLLLLALAIRRAP
jgi:hypothetical protein